MAIVIMISQGKFCVVMVCILYFLTFFWARLCELVCVISIKLLKCIGKHHCIPLMYIAMSLENPSSIGFILGFCHRVNSVWNRLISRLMFHKFCWHPFTSLSSRNINSRPTLQAVKLALDAINERPFRPQRTHSFIHVTHTSLGPTSSSRVQFCVQNTQTHMDSHTSSSTHGKRPNDLTHQYLPTIGFINQNGTEVCACRSLTAKKKVCVAQSVACRRVAVPNRIALWVNDWIFATRACSPHSCTGFTHTHGKGTGTTEPNQFPHSVQPVRCTHFNQSRYSATASSLRVGVPWLPYSFTQTFLRSPLAYCHHHQHNHYSSYAPSSTYQQTRRLARSSRVARRNFFCADLQNARRTSSHYDANVYYLYITLCLYPYRYV